jgi:soluble lytic murein transglycosylase
MTGPVSRALLACVCLLLAPHAVVTSGPAPAPPASAAFTPTAHPPIPRTAAEAWLVPGAEIVPTASERVLSEVLRRLGAADAAKAGGGVPDLPETSPLTDWAIYASGVSLSRSGKPADAMRVLEPLLTRSPESAVVELAARACADAAEAAGDLPRAVHVLATLAERPNGAPDDTLKRLADVASKSGEGGRARAAWLRIYYEHPLSPHAPLAEPLAAEARAAATAGPAAQEVLARDLARAEALFGARRFADARVAFERLLSTATGDAREVADLRVAECDYHLRRYPAAASRLEPWLRTGSRQAEARFYYASTLRSVGRADEFVTQVRALARDMPDSTWAEDGLNALATHFIKTNDDQAAADVFRQIAEGFPSGRHAPRAAWKFGWWQYKLGAYADAATVFERAAAAMPRADLRPAWLYWAGRAREAVGEQAEARSRYEVAVADYRHSYYGRLSAARLDGAEDASAPRAAGRAPAERTRAKASASARLTAAPATSTATTPRDQDPPNAAVIQRLLALQLWSEATAELQFAQRTRGTSPRLEATLAWIYQQQGDLRRGITAMKRAYPQYLAEGGEQLPHEITEVIFPLEHWDLIRKYAAARKLDPHLVAALIAQESTFDATARSSANAWGLMQLLPSTGRRLARAEGIRRFSASRLTDPDTNVKLGTRYLAVLIQRFGEAHLALASYNAGEARVSRWRAERPGIESDAFIDDIPFPETQNYVKKILGTAEDYRQVYPLAGAVVARK